MQSSCVNLILLYICSVLGVAYFNDEPSSRISKNDITAICYMTSCSLVDVYGCFVVMCCFQIQDTFLKYGDSTFTRNVGRHNRLHGVTCHKTVIFIVKGISYFAIKLYLYKFG